MAQSVNEMKETWVSSLGLTPGSGRSPGKGNGYSPEELHGQRSLADHNQSTGVTESHTGLSDYHFHFVSLATCLLSRELGLMEPSTRNSGLTGRW